MISAPKPAAQKIIKIRRDYNIWVANETMEDYALRFTPRSFRKWSEMRVANTAFGAASFLVLEAVGATMLVDAGFINAFWAILATGLLIFLLGLPVSYTAAKHGLDMDLLTRGAGFGYIGSTITSLIYASFTFIFFALEAAIMAYALELAFDIPPAWGYGICALVVIPLVSHGVTTISRLQVWTQPLWLAMLIVPLAYVLHQHPTVLTDIWHFGGIVSGTYTFWKNKFKEMTGTNLAASPSAANAISMKADMNNLWLSLNVGADKPDTIVMSHDFYALYELGEQQLQRYMDAELAESGFQTLKYKSANVIFDDNTNFSTTAEKAYFLNTKYLYLVQHSEANWTVDKEKVPTNQDAVVIPIYWMGNWACSNRSRQGVLFDAA